MRGALAAAPLALFLSCCRYERPPCRPEALAAIESAYMAEVLSQCEGRTAEECAELPEIERKYDSLRDEWVQCQ